LKILDVDYTPRWTTHMGCLKSCINYLGLDISDGWLCGGTGHAFVLNISSNLCPSGPTAWKSERIFQLGRNLGYTFDGVFSHKSMLDFKEKQRNAYDLVKKSIDIGYPCYGWELNIAEFYLINGYDKTGYLYKDTDGQQKDSKKWDTLGETGIGFIEMYSVCPGEAVNVRKIVKDSLEFAVEHARTRKYLLPNYESGLQGYETWIKGMRKKTATKDGVSYNAAVWSECRKYGIDFLLEAKEKLDNSDLFNEAIECYRIASQNLRSVVDLYSFRVPPDYETLITDTKKAETAIKYLVEAREAENKGLKELENIVSILENNIH